MFGDFDSVILTVIHKFTPKLMKNGQNNKFEYRISHILPPIDKLDVKYLSNPMMVKDPVYREAKQAVEQLLKGKVREGMNEIFRIHKRWGLQFQVQYFEAFFIQSPIAFHLLLNYIDGCDENSNINTIVKFSKFAFLFSQNFLHQIFGSQKIACLHLKLLLSSVPKLQELTLFHNRYNQWLFYRKEYLSSVINFMKHCQDQQLALLCGNVLQNSFKLTLRDENHRKQSMFRKFFKQRRIEELLQMIIVKGFGNNYCINYCTPILRLINSDLQRNFSLQKIQVVVNSGILELAQGFFESIENDFTQLYRELITLFYRVSQAGIERYLPFICFTQIQNKILSPLLQDNYNQKQRTYLLRILASLAIAPIDHKIPSMKTIFPQPVISKLFYFFSEQLNRRESIYILSIIINRTLTSNHIYEVYHLDMMFGICEKIIQIFMGESMGRDVPDYYVDMLCVLCDCMKARFWLGVKMEREFDHLKIKMVLSDIAGSGIDEDYDELVSLCTESYELLFLATPSSRALSDYL